MNIIIQYGTGVAALPKEVLKVMDRATKTDLKLLLLLASDPTLLSGTDAADCVRRLAAAAGCTPPQAATALAFWRGAGVLLLQGEDIPALGSPEESAPAQAPAAAPAQPAQPAQPTLPVSAPAKKPLPERTLPTYTSEELANLLESRADARTFITECTNIWGKILNVSEVNVLLSLVDYLGLEWDYVVTLLAFCAESLDKQGRKRSLRYFEKIAYEFYDEGILDLSALQEKLRRVEQSREAEGRFRRMTGIGDRELTATEKKVFSKWLYDFGFDMDIITMALEITVEAKGNYSIKYMDAVLTNWHNEGLKTPAEIRAHNEQYRAEHTPPPAKSPAPRRESDKDGDYKSSFDTDAFFYDAIKRSLGDDFDIDELKKAEANKKDPRG